jgi:hypothetical protein
MSAKKRIPIPAKTENDVMYSSDRLCCIDKKKGVHIHHVDGNPSNNEFNNLALLCFDCHDEATKTGSLSKKLSPGTIIKYRTYHYEVVSKTRQANLDKLTPKTTHPSYLDNLNLAIQANVLIEIAKIRAEYESSAEIDRTYIIQKLNAFHKYAFPRVSAELFEFLIQVSYGVRAGMSLHALFTVNSLMMDYFPPHGEKVTKVQMETVAKLAIEIAYGIIYDTSIYTSKYHSMKIGYDILQRIYMVGEDTKNASIKNDVVNSLNEIRKNLSRPERNDLGLAILMLETYDKHIQEKNHFQPNLSDELDKKVYGEKI